MTEVLVAPDPLLLARAWLLRYFPRVEVGVPDKWAWNDLLIVLSNTGGAGEYGRVLSESRLTVEVTHPRIAAASDAAFKCLALLQEWTRQTDGVYWRGEYGHPAYQPTDTGPAYIFTVGIAFKSKPVTINPL